MSPADAVLEIARISRADYRYNADFKRLGKALDALGITGPADRALIAQRMEFADDRLQPYPGKGRGVPTPFWSPNWGAEPAPSPPDTLPPPDMPFSS